MARVPFNPKIGRIKTDAGNFAVDRSFLAHYNFAPDAESDTAVMAATALGAEASSVAAGFANPDVPRNVKIKASAAQVTGATYKVKVYGTNFAGDAITEEINPGGTSASAGNLAFKTVTKVDLPARANTPAKQKATVAVTQGAQDAGTTVFTFISAATGEAFDVSVTFTADDDTTAEAAAKIVSALNAETKFSAKWTADSSEANITIEAKDYAAQDSTIDLTVKTAGDSAVTLGSITKDTVSGVAEDKISIGIGKKFGIPYMLAADELVIAKLFGGSADSGTVTNDADELEKNVIALNGTPDGTSEVDLYIIV